MKINTVGWIALLIFIAFMAYFISIEKKYNEIRAEGKWVVGTITTSGSNVICSFNVNGVEKTQKESSPNAAIVSGERYKVYYNEKYPDLFVISYDEPIIDTSFSKVSSKGLRLRFGSIEFHYNVNGKDYKRIQDPIDSIQIDLKMNYTVLYKKDNPYIAYLVYD